MGPNTCSTCVIMSRGLFLVFVSFWLRETILSQDEHFHLEL